MNRRGTVFSAWFVSLLACSGLLAGCGGSPTVNKGPEAGTPLAIPAASKYLLVAHVLGKPEVTQLPDWELLRAEWGKQLKAAAESQGMEMRFLAGEPKPSNEDGTVLVVRVSSYKYRAPDAGFGIGLLAGNAAVDADVEFIDLRSGKRFGERKYNTSSSVWQVVFSAMTDKQLAAISKELVGAVKGK